MSTHMSDNEKILITFIKESETPGSLVLLTITPNVEVIPEYCFEIPSDDILNFFKYLPTFMQKFVKAVILQLFEFEHPKYENNVQFRLMIAEELKRRQIKFQFIHLKEFNQIILLVVAKIVLKTGETVLTVQVSGKEIVVRELRRFEDGYLCPRKTGLRIIQYTNGYNQNVLRDDILASSNPKSIILTSCDPTPSQLFKDLKNKVLKSKKLIAFDNLDEKQRHLAMLEVATRIFDESYNKFFLFPLTFYDVFYVENEENLGNFDSHIGLSWRSDDGFPKCLTALAPRSAKPYYIAFLSYNKNVKNSIITRMDVLKGQFHKVNVSLTVDNNFLPYVTQTPFIDPAIEKLPKTLPTKIVSKIPVIGFFDNSSIICVWNETEKCYKFCENWNGLFGKDLFIAFNNEKPIFFDKAREALKTHPTFVIYDLLKIMSNLYYSVLIEPSPEWKFSVLPVEDDEENLLMVCDNFEGNRIGAIPEILMGRLISEHIRAIKKETKIKPKEIGFVFFDKENHSKCSFYHLLEDRMKYVCGMVGIKPREFVLTYIS